MAASEKIGSALKKSHLATFMKPYQTSAMLFDKPIQGA